MLYCRPKSSFPLNLRFVNLPVLNRPYLKFFPISKFHLFKFFSFSPFIFRHSLCVGPLLVVVSTQWARPCRVINCLSSHPTDTKKAIQTSRSEKVDFQPSFSLLAAVHCTVKAYFLFVCSCTEKTDVQLFFPMFATEQKRQISSSFPHVCYWTEKADLQLFSPCL